MNNDGNGKWQLAFWTIAFLFVTVTPFLGTAVIANDRIRAEEDAKIRIELVANYKDLLSQLNVLQKEILQRLVRIEARVNDSK